MGKIAEIVVPAGGQATIDFPAIDQTYKHLVLTLSARTNGAYVDTDLALTVNGDTTASYDDQYYSTTGAGGGGSAATGATSARAGLTAGANAVAGVFAETSIEIINYASTTFRKTWQVETFDHGNDAGNGFKIIESGQWRNTAAITRLTLTPSSGSFVVGTVATLFGIDPQTGIGTTVTTKTAAYTLSAADRLVLVNAANLTMTLPAVGSVTPGITYTIKNTGAGTGTTVAAASGQTIDGAATQGVTAADGSLTVQSDSTQWWIVAKV